MNYDYNDYNDLNFTINNIKYENGLGLDGKSIDGYDLRNFGQDKYKIIHGEYDKITGIFGFDDKTAIKASTDLVILQDDAETYRTTVDEKTPYKDVNIDVSPETKEITIRFEITGTHNDVLPMICFANIKARVCE